MCKRVFNVVLTQNNLCEIIPSINAPVLYNLRII